MTSRKKDQRIIEKIYSFIKEYIKIKKFSPTLEEIREYMEFRSVGRVERYLDQLDSLGLIIYYTSKHRGIKLVKNDFFEHAKLVPNFPQKGNSICIEGSIAAGLPINKFSDTEQMLDISSIQSRENTYALLVKGQSMIEDQICDGDYVIIKQQSTYQNGDIIVATHKLSGSMGSATLKHFFLDAGEKVVYLKPANSDFDPIVIPAHEWEQEWEVQGKLLSVLRLDQKL